MTKKQLEKYILLLKFMNKNCKSNKNCQKNYENIISYLNDNSVKFLCQCVRNLLAPKNIKLLGHKKEKLLLKKILPYKKTILKLTDKRVSLKQKRKKLQSGGAFIIPLLASIAPLIGSLISKVFKNKTGEEELNDV